MFQTQGLASEVSRERDEFFPTVPDGTITIMFTDIESFTALTERLGDRRTQEVLRAHWAIVREQVALHGGREVKTQGDSFMVTFRSARRALLCAMAVQRAMDGHGKLCPNESICVRIGLHAGEVISEAGDFFGKNVIVASRVADRARGGEILVSSLLKDLVESCGDFTFDQSRVVKLKGLTGSHRLFRVAWSEDSFAPAGTGPLAMTTERAHDGVAEIARDTRRGRE